KHQFFNNLGCILMKFSCEFFNSQHIMINDFFRCRFGCNFFFFLFWLLFVFFAIPVFSILFFLLFLLSLFLSFFFCVFCFSFFVFCCFFPSLWSLLDGF